MIYFLTFCLLIASWGYSSPLSLPEKLLIPCHEYDEFLFDMCTQYEGKWCGRPDNCFGGPFVTVPEDEIDFYFLWKATRIKVSCVKYDRYIAYKCGEQKKNHPGLIGGYCGRPSACQTSKDLYVPETEFESFTQWNDEFDLPAPMEVDCQDYDHFINYKCKDQMGNYPGLIGGWCGRRPTCQVSPKTMVPAREVEEYVEWKSTRP